MKRSNFREYDTIVVNLFAYFLDILFICFCCFLLSVCYGLMYGYSFYMDLMGFTLDAHGRPHG